MSVPRRSWWGLARPSGRTATASPPQMSLPPDSPKRAQRRRTRSVRRPSAVASHPSIGRMPNRLPTRWPRHLERFGHGTYGGAGLTDPGQLDAQLGAARARNAAAVVSFFTCGDRLTSAPPAGRRARRGCHDRPRGAAARRRGCRRGRSSPAARTTWRRRGGTRDGRPERQEPEVLEQIVQLVERRVAVGPHPVARAKRSGANVDRPSR